MTRGITYQTKLDHVQNEKFSLHTKWQECNKVIFSLASLFFFPPLSLHFCFSLSLLCYILDYLFSFCVEVGVIPRHSYVQASTLPLSHTRSAGFLFEITEAGRGGFCADENDLIHVD